MMSYNFSNTSSYVLHVTLVTIISLSSVSVNADNSDSKQRLSVKENKCKRIISHDKSLVVLKDCDEADVDLITDKGSKIRIKSKGKSNSVIVNIGN